jgi:glycosyltransferase involved in cell wall biosynthesis
MGNPKACHLTTVHNRFDNRIFHKECVSLASHSFDVTLLVSDGKGDEINRGILIKDMGSYPGIGKRIFFESLKFFFNALKQRADIYHFHDPELIVSGFLLKLTGKKVIYDIHEDYITAITDRNYIHPVLARLFSKIYHAIEKILTIGTEKIIAERYYNYRFPHSTPILNYPRLEEADISYSDDTSKANPVKKELLYTGNVTEERGAFTHAKILKQIDDVKLTCVGHCPSFIYEKIRSCLGADVERFMLKGLNYYVPFSDVKKEYRKDKYLAGLAVFPRTKHYYQKELTKLFEYMQAGLPVICSDFPVWRNIIEGAQCGITVDPENKEELKEAINDLKDNPEKAWQMGINGREAVFATYNWVSQEKKLVEFYHYILKSLSK